MTFKDFHTTPSKRSATHWAFYFIVVAGLFSSLPVSAQVVYGARPPATADDRVYTWVDSRGIRHYGDATLASPNEFARSQPRDLRLTMPSELRHGSNGNGQAQDSSTEPSPRSTDEMTASWEEGANPSERLAPTRDAACQVARRNVSVLSDASQPAYVRDDSGNPIQLDAQGRAQRLEQAHSDEDAYCS